ncbi:hypothetical protein DL96DRAFT_351351 [Flagelloscypha sp. PMI_526]|nr:hypothetical protein DL96DRAFT_351351 [Flagelloscypha sp. PMI_526]
MSPSRIYPHRRLLGFYLFASKHTRAAYYEVRVIFMSGHISFIGNWLSRTSNSASIVCPELPSSFPINVSFDLRVSLYRHARRFTPWLPFSSLTNLGFKACQRLSFSPNLHHHNPCCSELQQQTFCRREQPSQWCQVLCITSSAMLQSHCFDQPKATRLTFAEKLGALEIWCPVSILFHLLGILCLLPLLRIHRKILLLFPLLSPHPRRKF